ncbi:hypothetical protein M2273_005380 [Mucilaginibacter lappiensis]|jgi:hypothetical protein
MNFTYFVTTIRNLYIVEYIPQSASEIECFTFRRAIKRYN